ncbi:MAG TPA: Ig-like domain-containing protein, partial [Cytophagales bacterium]|nr:Ig-like domain-containing protein [Cytophagales bacterium]
MPPHPDLDVALTLKNSNGTTITTANPATSLDASFVTVLPAGKYYVIVDGIGNGDPQGTGYSDYSSIGQYKITGNIIANTPPQVTLNAGSPVVNYYGTRYVTAGSLFELFTSPTDVEGPIAKVEFYQNDVKIGEDAFYPGHSWYVSNLAAGTYVFKAKAFDQGGLTTWSEPITIIVDGTAPTVSITSPANNATFTTPANFEVGTYPTDGQGPIRKVEFYQNNVLVGYDDLYPSFSYYAYNLAAGTYTYTAKAYDIAGNNTTSAPITVTVTAACAVNEVTPPASQFVVRNAWSDQNYGSTVINESAALKIVQRAYGNSDLWVLESGKTFSVTSGQTYNIKFDYKDYAPIGVHGIEVGFATGINNTNTAPILSGTPVSFPAGYSSSTFTTKSVNLTASATATVFLAIKLKWNNQPNSTLSTYLKNLKVCSGASTQSRLEAADEETSLQGITLNPNPSAFTFTTEVQRDLNTIHVADLQGRIVYMGKSMSKDSILSFGEDFNAGIYIVMYNMLMERKNLSKL